MTAIGAREHELAAAYYGRRAATARGHGVGQDFVAAPRADRVGHDRRAPPDAVAAALGKKGLLVWDGDFYAARAIEVLGLAERGGVLRTGISMYNTRAEVERLLAGVAELAAR